MDGILAELAKEVPAIVSIVIVVFMFHRSLGKIADKFIDFVNEQTKKHEALTDRTNLSIERNSVLYGQIIEILRKMNGHK